MSSITITTVNRQQIFEKTVEILIALSLLFLPFTFFVSTSVHLHILYVFSQNILTFKTFTTLLTIAVTAILSTVAGIVLITNTTALSCHPGMVAFAYRSLSDSFISLLKTFIAGFIKLAFVFLVITFSPIAVDEAINTLNLGFRFDLAFFSTIASVIGVITVLFFIVIWASAAPISVLESKYGFEPLRESANQSFQFRLVSFTTLLLPLSVILSFYSYYVTIYYMGTATKWDLIVQLVANYLMSLLMILLYVVQNTVLYLQCKAACGEDAVNTTVEEEVSDDDSGLPQGFTCIMLLVVIIWCVTHFISVFGF